MADISWHFTGKDFFWELPLEKRDFVSLSTLRKIKKNQMIFLEGNRGNSVFYLEEGKVRIFRISPFGKEIIIFIRQPGEMFGLAEVIGKHDRVFSAQAITPCRLYEIRGKEFETLLQRHHTLAQRVIAELGRRLRYLGEQIDSLMVCDVSTRLLKLLMCISCHNVTDPSEMNRPILVSLKLTQEQIAAMIGSTQQTVSETLKRLKEDGLIEILGKEITLLKPQKIFDLLLL
ncbi:MAG: Crp/Fnr family transcriptional regulator [Syntrophus sp. (in: bacteria)]|nr:Crp/Fnr family transcriptional regulator [Syntrophus sp. (in: bacteria)]